MEYEPQGTVPIVGDQLIEVGLPSRGVGTVVPFDDWDIGMAKRRREIYGDDAIFVNWFLDDGSPCGTYAVESHWSSPEFRILKRKPSRVLKKKVKSSETILKEAQRLTSGDRNADYGHPLDDYSKTGMIWGALLHSWAKESAESPTPIPVPPELACLCMTGVKLSREVNKSKRDNLVDGAGYLRLVEMIQGERKKRNGK